MTLDLAAVAGRLARLLGLTGVEPVAGGLEFAVFRAYASTGAPLALRVPREKVYRTPGEVPVPAARLQEQERLLYRVLNETGLPVPQPVRLIEDTRSGLPVLVAEFVCTDGGPARPAEVGQFLAELHGLPVGRMDLVTHEHTTGILGLAARLRRRWAPLREQIPDLPELPALEPALAELDPATTSLLHMDIRAGNLLAVAGTLRAVVDWSSAMVAHPAVEFARLREYAQLDENGIDLPAITAEYRRHLPVPRVAARAEAVLRLDTVSMLALVFLREAPDPDRANWAVGRVRELVEAIGR